MDDLVVNLRDTLYSGTVAATTRVAVNMPGDEHVALTAVFAPKLVSAFGELAIEDSGTLISKTTAVASQLAPLPVQSFSGAESVSGVPAPVGSC